MFDFDIHDDHRDIGTSTYRRDESDESLENLADLAMELGGEG